MQYFEHTNRFFTFFFLLLITLTISAQTGSLSGKITNGENAQGINGVNIIIVEINKGTSTNEAGEFLLNNIPAGTYFLDVSCIGFKKEQLQISIHKDSVNEINIVLQPVSLFLGKIPVLSSRYEQFIKEVPIPISLQTSEEIKKTPSLTVSDALKNLPGVSLTRDGIWGTYVSIRGFNRSSIVTLIDGNRIETANDIAAG